MQQNEGGEQKAFGSGPGSISLYLVHGQPPDAGEGEAVLRAVKALLRHAWLIVAGSVLFALIGLVYVALATPRYLAEVVLAPVEEQSFTASLRQFGSLASLAGLDLSGAGSSIEPIAVLRSRGFARHFIELMGIERDLIDDDRSLARLLGLSRPQEQDIRDAVAHFTKVVRSVSEDRRTGLVTISISWTDPEVAAAWANHSAELLDDRLRSTAREEAEHNVQFLREELRSADPVTLQQSVGRLLEAELQKLMLARGGSAFAYQIVDPAVAPKKPAKPRRVLVVALCFVLGAAIASGIVILREFLSRENLKS